MLVYTANSVRRTLLFRVTSNEIARIIIEFTRYHVFRIISFHFFIVCIVLLLLISHRYISTDIVYHFGCACGRSGIQLSFHSFLCSFHSNNCFANKEFKEQIHFQPDIITFNVLCNLTFHCSKRAPFNATMFACTSCWH